MLHFLPWLEKLDDVAVTIEEVTEAQEIELEQLIAMVETMSKEKQLVQTTFMPPENL